MDTLAAPNSPLDFPLKKDLIETAKLIKDRSEQLKVNIPHINHPDEELVHRCRLMLYLPWRDEETDLLGQYATFAEHLVAVQHTVEANESKFTKQNEIDDLADGMSAPEHIWDEMAPRVQQEERIAEDEGMQEKRHVDIDDNTQPVRSSVHARWQAEAEKNQLSPTQYRETFLNLNQKQK